MDKKDLWSHLYKPWVHPDEPPVYWAMLKMKDGREFRYSSSGGKRFAWSSPAHIKASVKAEQNLLVGNRWRWIAPVDHPDVECVHIFDNKGQHVETIRRDEHEGDDDGRR